MDRLPFRYEDWMAQTSGGVFAMRSACLKALDEAIRKYDRAASMESATADMKNDILQALSAFLAEEEARGGVEAWKRGPRNKGRIIEQLVDAVTGGANANLTQLTENYAEWPVPTVVEPQIHIPPPAPEPPAVDPALEKKAEKWSVAAVEVSPVAIAPAGGQDPTVFSAQTQQLRFKIEGLYSDLVRLKGEVNTALIHAAFNFTECVRKGFNDFKDLHKLDAEDIAFNFSLIGYAFKGLSYLPFPLSTIGAVGEALAGLATTDTHHGSLRLDLPTPGGLKGAIEEKAAVFSRFRNQNVSPKDIKSQERLIFEFLDFVANFKTTVDAVFNDQIKDIDNVQKREALFNKHMGDIQGKANPAQVQQKLSEADHTITSIGQGIRNQCEPLKNMVVSQRDQIAIWITMLMIAEYAITGLCQGKEIKAMKSAELGKTKFGDKFARWMATPEVGIVQLKQKSGESYSIYKYGKIPWDGSPNHIIAVMLYLDWYRRTFNPFDLFRPNVTPQKFKGGSTVYIMNLGRAMSSHKLYAIEDVAGFHKVISR